MPRHTSRFEVVPTTTPGHFVLVQLPEHIGSRVCRTIRNGQVVICAMSQLAATATHYTLAAASTLADELA